MNRAWEAPQRHVAPPVYYLKRLIKDIKAVCEVLLFCDFHGHSRKRDVFLYGCHCDDDPPMRFHERVFPHVLAQCCPSFEMSPYTFKVQDATPSPARLARPPEARDARLEHGALLRGPRRHRSGDRLREWMGVTREVFYDPARVAILPMGFCFPGTGKSGDLPPRKECAEAWRDQLLKELVGVKLTLVIGQYAARWHLGLGKESLTATVKDWKEHRPAIVPLPHPSPRNNIWLAKNPWFGDEVLPYLKRSVRRVLK